MGQKIVDDFMASIGKGKIKSIITDRGFLDGPMISCFKNKYGVDTLIPLKKNMDAYQDVAWLSRIGDRPWQKVDDIKPPAI